MNKVSSLIGVGHETLIRLFPLSKRPRDRSRRHKDSKEGDMVHVFEKALCGL